MAYLIRKDVNAYGSVDAPEDPVPIRVVVDHDWLHVPFPALASIVTFEWEPGEAGEKPDVFWYPKMWDWVCAQKAYDVLMGAAAADLHLIAEGRLDGEPVFLVQVVTVLNDVVDREHSIIERYPTYEVLQFPAFFRSAAPTVASRIFRVPGSHFKVFMGETVKQALDTAGIKGFLYVPVDWSE
ncbi:MAG TPA: hypothetical protein VGR57_10100 [Ktedonobacterales bacterium]|nr:hypothetical protein [Ktedonobacterales bacterium]